MSKDKDAVLQWFQTILDLVQIHQVVTLKPLLPPRHGHPGLA
jgi:hypothetical protein